jgi:hypothetical protein
MSPDFLVVPAEAGTHFSARSLFPALFGEYQRFTDPWTPTFAGVTTRS